MPGRLCLSSIFSRAAQAGGCGCRPSDPLFVVRIALALVVYKLHRAGELAEVLLKLGLVQGVGVEVQQPARAGLGVFLELVQVGIIIALRLVPALQVRGQLRQQLVVPVRHLGQHALAGPVAFELFAEEGQEVVPAYGVFHKRDEQAVAAVFEGLVIGVIAMTFAGVSRPASGVEHYISHVWDMRGA
ncbi:MAG: iron-containing alcohol dehydrogenase, partial [Clostridia bacterium]|nr:iron-containing alcohol dehydrogenase [Clostridia bacterium]